MTARTPLPHAVSVGVSRGSARFDLWFAVAAGPGPWLGGDRLAPVDRLLLAGGVGSALALALAVTASAGASLQFDSVATTGLFGLTMAALVTVLFGVGVGLGALGPTAVVLSRTVAALVVLALTVRAYGSVQPLLLSGFGLAVGAHATVTLRAIGATLRWVDALRRFLTSTVHAGVVTGGIILFLLPSTRSIRQDVVALGLSLYALAGVSTATMAVLATLLARIDAGRDSQVAAVRAAIHRDQAQWIHDDVCSELGHLRLRLQKAPVEPGVLGRCLDDLDHRLRIRQIDEILDGGPGRLGEIMQPYLRMAQTNGVDLVEVPSFETGAMLLPPVAGRQVQRAMAVLTANAIQAGAKRLSIRTSTGPAELLVEIDDDAGGFDVTQRIAGRGLDSLAHHLEPGRLELIATTRGTLARVHVVLADDFARHDPLPKANLR